MTEYRRILLTASLSPAADRAMMRAVRLATAKAEQGGELAVIHVRSPQGDDALAHLSRAGAEAEIRRHLAVLPGAADLSPLVVCLDGPVDVMVADFADKWGADLMVAGIHQPDPLTSLFSVSMVERISTASPLPLLVVRNKPFGPYVNALVAVDFGDRSAPALAAAAALVPRGSLTLLHVADIPGALGVDVPAHTLEDHFQAVMRQVDLSALTSVDRVVRRGVPMVEITAQARVDAPDLIVMATAGRRGLSRAILGSVAHEVLEHLPSDVLLVRETTTA